MSQSPKDYTVPWPQAIQAGMLGALAATVFMWFVFAVGMTNLNLPLLVGSIIRPVANDGTALLGGLILILAGAPVGIAYAAFFRWGHHLNVGLGLILGFIQWMAAGLVLPILSYLSPAVPESIDPPGFYGIREGMNAFALFFVANLLYGGVVTALEHRRRRGKHGLAFHQPTIRDRVNEQRRASGS